MPTLRRRLLFFCLLLSAARLSAAEPLRIGIHDKPPYAMKSKDGTWNGLAVAVWKDIATNTGIAYEFVEVPYEDILAQVNDGRLDAAIGEIEVTPTVAKNLDFTQPYLIASIGIAIESRHWQNVWKSALSEFFNWTIAQLLIGLFLAMLIVSILIWLAERRHHTGHFRGGIDGIGSALWFSAATMTTVGYGDKTPSTFFGRVIAIFWMLAGVLLVSAFTATVASSMSAARINNSVSLISDFHHLTCGVLKGSLSAELAKNIGINTVDFEELQSALADLGKHNVDAVIADKNSLLYLQRQLARSQPPQHFRVPELSLRDAFIAIPFHKGHPDYDKINQALLQFTASPTWQGLLQNWLGSPGARL
jgi:ABC-type amino acid transport substrate-binding protein